MNPKLADAYFNRGLANAVLGQYADAFDDFTKAIDWNPEAVDAYHNRGITKRILGDPVGAREDFEMEEQLKVDKWLSR